MAREPVITHVTRMIVHFLCIDMETTMISVVTINPFQSQNSDLSKFETGSSKVQVTSKPKPQLQMLDRTTSLAPNAATESCSGGPSLSFIRLVHDCHNVWHHRWHVQCSIHAVCSWSRTCYISALPNRNIFYF